MRIISWSRWMIALVASVVLVGGAFSVAAALDRGPSRSGADKDVTAAVIGGAQAPNARLAALIDAGGAPIRTKGVASVSRIDVGVYCIQPGANSGISVVNAIVVAAPEYFYSELDEISVQWASRSNGCPSGWFGVYTFADADRDGNYTLSDQVGFSIMVP